MPKHIVNLLILMGGFLAIAISAKTYFTDPSFYRFGHYRADAVAELATGEPLFRGGEHCLTCHAEGHEAWRTNAHRTVQCEVCHGTSRGHPDDGELIVPTDTARLCTICHEAMPGRPERQPQIVSGEHPFPDEPAEPCQNCHDPHAPGEAGAEAERDGAAEVAGGPAGPAASPPASAAKCAKCHGDRGQGAKKNPPIAGLQAGQFLARMNDYRTGAREHRMMAKLANSLSDEELTELADFYAGLPPAAAE